MTWTPIFAQTDAPQGWVALVVQTGAIGILGYHLLVGLPAMFKEWRESQEKMQVFLASVFQKAIDNSRDDFTARSATLVGELTKQTGLLGRIHDKIEEWPSDAEKICKAAECRRILETNGVDPKTIDRVLRVRGLTDHDLKSADG